jgi:hypothetical protein
VELGQELLDGRGRRPGLDGVVARGGERDQVDQPSGRDGVVHQVVAGADPQRLGVALGEVRCAVGRDEGAEGADARVGGGRRLGGHAAHDRVDAVRPDHDVGFDGVAVREAQDGAPVAADGHVDAPPAQVDPVVRDG